MSQLRRHVAEEGRNPRGDNAFDVFRAKTIRVDERKQLVVDGGVVAYFLAGCGLDRIPCQHNAFDLATVNAASGIPRIEV